MGFIVIALLTSFFSFIALYSGQSTKDEIASGKPSLLAVMDYTGIHDRTKIVKLFGNPNRDDVFDISPDEIKSFKNKKKTRFLDNEWVDNFCVVGPLVSIWGRGFNYNLAAVIVSVCLLVQALGWVLAFVNASKIVTKNGL
jgi:hypothetical protein